MLKKHKLGDTLIHRCGVGEMVVKTIYPIRTSFHNNEPIYCSIKLNLLVYSLQLPLTQPWNLSALLKTFGQDRVTPTESSAFDAIISNVDASCPEVSTLAYSSRFIVQFYHTYSQK